MSAVAEGPTREQWIADRATYAGGTDAAAILGVHPYKSSYEVWCEKLGLVQRQESPAMRFGRMAESMVVDMYAEQFGFGFEESGVVRHPERPFLAGNPDRLFKDRPGILEVKTTKDNFTGDGWGEPGTDQVPKHYLIQGVYYLMLTNREFCDFALFRRDTCEVLQYRVWRDMELESTIVSRVVQWWERHVVGGDPVDPDGSESASELIKAQLPKGNGLEIAATPEVEEWIANLIRVKAQIKEFEALEVGLSNRIKLFMGEASALTSVHGKVTWKNNKDSTETDWQALALSLSPKPEQIAPHQKAKPGNRVFRLPKAKEF